MNNAYKWEDGVLEYVGGVSQRVQQRWERRIKAVFTGLEEGNELRGSST